MLWCIVCDVSDCPNAIPFVPQCGTQAPSKEALEKRRIWIRDTPTKVSKSITVDTYFHLVYYKGNSKVDFKKDFRKKYRKQVRVVALLCGFLADCILIA